MFFPLAVDRGLQQVFLSTSAAARLRNLWLFPGDATEERGWISLDHHWALCKCEQDPGPRNCTGV